MVNIQSYFIIILLLYLISNNWFNISVFNKKITALIFITKGIICFFIFYYFSKILGLENKSDLHIYFNQALKLDGTLNGDRSSIINIIIGNEHNYNTILSKLTLWERDFDYGILNDNKTMIKIHLILNILVGKYIINHTLIFIIFSFTCLLILLKNLNQHIVNKKILVLVSFLPSILIWSNVTFKENLAISIHLLIISTILKFNSKVEIKNIVVIIFLCLINLLIKPIYLFLMIPFFISLLLYKSTGLRNGINKLLILFFMTTLTLFSIYKQDTRIEKDEYKSGNKFNLLKMIEFKQDDFFYEAYHKNAKTLVRLTPLGTTNYSILKSSYEAFINVFTLPSIFYPKLINSIPFILENILLYILIITLLLNIE